MLDFIIAPTKSYTQYVHSHCFGNTLLATFVNQSQLSALSSTQYPRKQRKIQQYNKQTHLVYNNIMGD